MHTKCTGDHDAPACADPACSFNDKVCEKCGEVLTPFTAYQEILLDRTQPEGVRLLDLCQKHWIAIHERR